MSDLRIAAQQALEALIGDQDLMVETAEKHWEYKTDLAIAALRDALAQEHEPVQEPGQDLIPPDSLFVCGQMGAHVTRVRLAEPAQEPVAWVECDGELVWNNREAAIGRNLYTAPPQRPPLTDEEILDIIDAELEGGSLLDVARAIERKVRGE